MYVILIKMFDFYNYYFKSLVYSYSIKLFYICSGVYFYFLPLELITSKVVIVLIFFSDHSFAKRHIFHQNFQSIISDIEKKEN